MTTNRSPARAKPSSQRFPSGADCSLEVTLETDLFLDTDEDETITSLTCRMIPGPETTQMVQNVTS